MKKIKSILIANRGEIAIRIISTSKKMGIKTFAIKTNKEPNAVYLNHADEICDFTENYDEIPDFLDVDKIIETALTKKIDAIHPGYGFLAESPYFAKKCQEVNIIFIGPDADAIFKMGNKTIAKQIAKKHNVPLLEGSKGNVANPLQAIEIANKIGYPVILKAASGGGGRGMRIVENESQMENMFRMASSEAEKAFNDPSVFVEKYVKNPRHIEFQILGDKFGNIIHLGERECSIQRKHQKLIEESPSPALTDELRKNMGETAIRIAQAVKYHSAGTVEFLLDDDNNYYFMEMNTRIQVEHPVTEEITGIDLVEQMIKIAAGEKLSISQDDVKINGWAIECRINAEDVQTGFSPNLGTIEKISFPKGKNIRVDTGVESGSVITPYYDSMIAKLIVHGENREKALANALSALSKIRIKGVKTTIPFCRKVLNNQAFIDGNYNTSFIENELDKLYYQDADEELLAAYFATYVFAQELREESETFVDFEKGKNINPWVLNKRLR